MDSIEVESKKIPMNSNYSKQRKNPEASRAVKMEKSSMPAVRKAGEATSAFPFISGL